MEGNGTVWSGLAGQAGFVAAGRASSGEDGQVKARQARSGEEGNGTVWLGQVRLGLAGKSWQAGYGLSRYDEVS